MPAARDQAESPAGRRPHRRDGRPGGEPDIVIDDPAELAATVPALLGFHPRDSLVVVSLGGTSGRLIGLTLRTDLPPRSTPPAERADLCRTVVDTLLRDRPGAAAVLVFAAAAGPDLPHRPLVEAMTDALGEHAVPVLTALWAEGTAVGASWACYGPCGCRGVLPDPDTTALAAEAVLRGRVVHRSREELEQALAPVDPGAVRRREHLLLDRARAVRAMDTAPESPRDLLRIVDRAIADGADGTLVLDDAQVVELAWALADPTVRDSAMVRCLGPAAAAAEQLWAALVREVPDPEAAEPAVLLAACALLRGDGGLANVALARAERAWPGHVLTGLLRVLAASGTSPTEARKLLGESLDGVAGWSAQVRRAGGGSARTSRRRRPSC